MKKISALFAILAIILFAACSKDSTTESGSTQNPQKNLHNQPADRQVRL